MINPCRRGAYREPRVVVVAIAPGHINGRAFCDAGIPAVACSAGAVLRNRVTAEFRLMGGPPEGCLLVSTTGRPSPP